MPVVTVRTWEDSLDEATEATLIALVTDAVAASLGEHVRPHTTVLLSGFPRRRWGTAGVPAGPLTDAGTDPEAQDGTP